MTSQNIAEMIDHTYLKSDATEKTIASLCEEAKDFGAASVCVNPLWVSYAAEKLADSKVKVCTVVGFPLGSSYTEAKTRETTMALDHGANEIDMVVNLPAVLSGDFETVEQDIRAVAETAHEKSALLKVILETCLLTDDQIVAACKAAVAAGADFVKTSTGFSTGGATVEAVRLMKETVGENAEVKASGGIKNLADAEAMIEAGATRLGTSSAADILAGKNASSSY